MHSSITGLYAALLTIVCLALYLRIGPMRAKYDVSLGDGGKPEMIVAIRQHMNFVEHVPLALILIALAEYNGASAGWVHALGGGLLLARVVHPFGLSANNMKLPARFIGAILTAVVQLAAAITLLWQLFGR